jgi:molecular chaperone Hsp33
MSDKDYLYRFLFEAAPIRGEIVHLDASWREVSQRGDYPPAVRELLGQMLTASLLLSATLKFEGKLIMQVQGSGPMTMAVVQCDSQRHVRGLAHWSGEPQSSQLNALAGTGYLAITLEPDKGERYQGIVELGEDSLLEALENYLERSEQLDTKLWINVGANGCSGLLLQKLPDGPQGDADAWPRVVTLAATLKAEELQNLPVREVLRRLFHEEDLRLFDPEPVSFRCSCTQDKVRNMLRLIGREEVESILDERGEVEVHCEYCNQRYVFDAVDAQALFADAAMDAKPTRH